MNNVIHKYPANSKDAKFLKQLLKNVDPSEMSR